MSFFWQSQPHLPKLDAALGHQRSRDTGTISSPLRRIHHAQATKVLALSPVPEARAKFSGVAGLAPHEIMAVQADHTDYVCGVERRGRTCKNSLHCSKHAFGERRAVRRTRPLAELLYHEAQNRAEYAKRRRLVKFLYRCRTYWGDDDPYGDAKTCIHTSCANTPDRDASPCVVSHNSTMKDTDGWRASLLTQSFLKRMSRGAADCRDDFVAYLFYRLDWYQLLDEDIRVREIEARFEDDTYATETCSVIE